MKLLLLADEECKALWDYYKPGVFDGYDLILAAGDLKAEYLEFIETMSRKPLVYVPGNHDKKLPEGCICADGDVVNVKGIRILGLGGSAWYNGGQHQYTERDMWKRITKIGLKVLKAGGVDIVLSHVAPSGLGDGEDYAHRGFSCFLKLLDKVQPVYWIHGHVHMNYGADIPRMRQYHNTTIINAYERYELEVTVPMKQEKENKPAMEFARSLEKVSKAVHAVTDADMTDYRDGKC